LLKRAASIAAAGAFIASQAVGLAWGHEETALHALSVIDRVSPHVPGISFRVVQLTQPVIAATNRTGRPLVIADDRGDPFLRLVRGRVEVNLASPLTYVSRDPTDRSRAPANLDAGQRPRWQFVERGRTWSWFDPRIRFAPGTPSWELRARLGDRAIVITGGFEPLEGHGHFQTELTSVPRIPGLEIRLLQGAIPGLFVRNETDRVLKVRGRGGEPFLRIGPAGVVANERSPDYYLGGAQTIRALPGGLTAGEKPRWRRLSRVPIWNWLELRSRLPDRLHQRALLGPVRRTVVRWTTPMTLGRTGLELRGRVVWVPPLGVADEATPRVEPLWIGAVAAMLLAVALIGRAAVLKPRKRRARGFRPSD